MILFLASIAKSDTSAERLVPVGVGFFTYVILSVALYHWTVGQIGNAYKAAFVIATSQFLLVNVDFVLAGKRGILTGAASTLLMFVTWICIAFAYSYFDKNNNTN